MQVCIVSIANQTMCCLSTVQFLLLIYVNGTHNFVLKSMYGIQFLEEYWTSFESFIHKYIGYIWALKVDDNIIMIPFSTSLAFKIYSFVGLTSTTTKASHTSFQALGLSGYVYLLSRYSACPVLFMSWSQVLFTHITESPTDNLWSSLRYISSMAVSFQQH